MGSIGGRPEPALTAPILLPASPRLGPPAGMVPLRSTSDYAALSGNER
jgi:hypothetical protein